MRLKNRKCGKERKDIGIFRFPKQAVPDDERTQRVTLQKESEVK